MSEDIVIRPATPADAEAMRAIFNHEVAYTTGSWEWVPLTEAGWQEWVDEHTRDDRVLLVADRGGEVLGFAGYGRFRTKAGYVTTVEDSVFLKAGCRGQGLGRTMLGALIEAARARGVHAMVAAVTGENTASIGLHTAMGFREVGRMPQVGHKFGRWLDLVLLQLLLDAGPAPAWEHGSLNP